MKKAMNIMSVIVLCVLFAAIMLTVSTSASAATPGGWSVSKARYSFLNKSQKKIFNKATKKLTGVSYLFLSTANDIPTLLNLDIMDENSIMLNVAYAMITAYTVGDFLAFTLTFAPHLAIPMMLGRLLCGLLIIMICLCVIRKTPAHIDSNIDSNKAEQAG